MKRPYRTFNEIASKHLNIPTLRTRKSDSLDFHQVGVWAVRSALKAAFDAGVLSADMAEPERPRKAIRAATLLLDMVRFGVLSLGDGDAEFKGSVYTFDAAVPDWNALLNAIGWDTAAAVVAEGAAQ